MSFRFGNSDLYKCPHCNHLFTSRILAEDHCLATLNNTDPTDPNPTLNNPVLNNATLNNHTLSNPTLNNPTLSNPTLNDPTLSNPTLSNPTLNNPTLNDPTRNDPTLSFPTLSNPTLNNPTLNDPTLSNPTLNNPTLATVTLQKYINQKDGRFKCSQCDQIFDRITQVRNHWAMNHLRIDTFLNTMDSPSSTNLGDKSSFIPMRESHLASNGMLETAPIAMQKQSRQLEKGIAYLLNNQSPVRPSIEESQDKTHQIPPAEKEQVLPINDRALATPSIAEHSHSQIHHIAALDETVKAHAAKNQPVETTLNLKNVAGDYQSRPCASQNQIPEVPRAGIKKFKIKFAKPKDGHFKSDDTEKATVVNNQPLATTSNLQNSVGHISRPNESRNQIPEAPSAEVKIPKGKFFKQKDGHFKCSHEGCGETFGRIPQVRNHWVMKHFGTNVIQSAESATSPIDSQSLISIQVNECPLIEQKMNETAENLDYNQEEHHDYHMAPNYGEKSHGQTTSQSLKNALGFQNEVISVAVCAAEQDLGNLRLATNFLDPPDNPVTKTKYPEITLPKTKYTKQKDGCYRCSYSECGQVFGTLMEARSHWLLIHFRADTIDNGTYAFLSPSPNDTYKNRNLSQLPTGDSLPFIEPKIAEENSVELSKAPRAPFSHSALVNTAEIPRTRLSEVDRLNSPIISENIIIQTDYSAPPDIETVTLDKQIIDDIQVSFETQDCIKADELKEPNGMSSSAESEPYNEPAEGRSYICRRSGCYKMYKLIGFLINHMLTDHGEIMGEFKCHCGKTFRYQRKFRSHLARHKQQSKNLEKRGNNSENLEKQGTSKDDLDQKAIMKNELGESRTANKRLQRTGKKTQKLPGKVTKKLQQNTAKQMHKSKLPEKVTESSTARQQSTASYAQAAENPAVIQSSLRFHQLPKQTVSSNSTPDPKTSAPQLTPRHAHFSLPTKINNNGREKGCIQGHPPESNPDLMKKNKPFPIDTTPSQNTTPSQKPVDCKRSPWVWHSSPDVPHLGSRTNGMVWHDNTYMRGTLVSHHAPTNVPPGASSASVNVPKDCSAPAEVDTNLLPRAIDQDAESQTNVYKNLQYTKLADGRWKCLRPNCRTLCYGLSHIMQHLRKNHPDIVQIQKDDKKTNLRLSVKPQSLVYNESTPEMQIMSAIKSKYIQEADGRLRCSSSGCGEVFTRSEQVRSHWLLNHFGFDQTDRETNAPNSNTLTRDSAIYTSLDLSSTNSSLRLSKAPPEIERGTFLQESNTSDYHGQGCDQMTFDGKTVFECPIYDCPQCNGS